VGVGGQGMWGCMLHALPSELPGATADVFDHHYGAVCLWGFPAGRDVFVELYDPSGQLVAAREVTIDQEWDGVGVAEVFLSLVGRPTGTWAMVATLDAASVTAPLYVEKPDIPWVSVVSAESDPFLGYGWRPPRGSIFALGDSVTVFGDGFPPGRTLPLGFYYKPESDYPNASQLVFSQVVVADDQGSFEVHMSAEALARQGDGSYCAVVPLSPAYDPMSPTLWTLGAWAPFAITSSSGDKQ
jgi:hypothetical protein